MGTRSSHSQSWLDYRIKKLRRQIRRRQKELGKLLARRRRPGRPCRMYVVHVKQL